MISTSYRFTTSQAGAQRGMERCGVVLGSEMMFGERPKPMIGELDDLSDTSRGSP